MTQIFTPPETRIAIVTGGARGIGAAIATRLAEDGHDVAILDLDREQCADSIRAVEATGRRGMAVSADVSDEDAVRRAVAQVADTFGPPTVLVNNAGVLRDASLSKMTVRDWDFVLDVNLRSAFLMSREMEPHFRATRWGRVVNLSSIAALGVFGEANYAAAKAGVQGFTKSLAIELGRFGVTANVVAPGFVITEMTREVARRVNMSIEDMTKEMMVNNWVGRAGIPEDIANAVGFFADVRSAFVTGQVLYVAGGPRG
ncbi:SDR family oxidoreductase [Novosphingobium sp.]|jgi:3-oxoacyl-[acyl-carrier protein] reductase|uniref:SDR family oxidoreductase n=1 Tax=Novosphingobium sp. TaxID=1874826 RepID=UPI00262D96D5|nr:SDR family oxidoreductase [Novosphingobium sp.]